VVLLFVLFVVAVGSWQQRRMATDWQEPLWVAIHPVAADGSPSAVARVASLEEQRFAPLEAFFRREAERHGVLTELPVTIHLAPPLAESPPLPPRDGGIFSIAAWSLQLRWWAWRIGQRDGSPPADIRLFVRYFDPETQPRLPHSVGLEQGRIGIVNAFSGDDQAGSNLVVIAHELLHTLGASDKYDPATNLPKYPEGYAEPELRPRHPQSRAELMGGRIPLGRNRAVIPGGLDDVLVGPVTATEIRWRH